MPIQRSSPRRSREKCAASCRSCRKAKCRLGNQDDCNTISKWKLHFDEDDLEMVKKITKLQDLDGLPLMIGAIVLRSQTILESLLKLDYCINQCDKNNMTPLIWAAKMKNIEMIKTLLANGADHQIRSVQGDSAVCLALGSKQWSEDACISFITSLKNTGKFDVNEINKSHFSLLHLAVRRDWKQLVNLLIASGANLNNATSNGVTPLMLASYRNNALIVDQLLTRGANIMQQNLEGFTAMCYAMYTAISKKLHAPFVVINRLQSELLKINIDLNDYLQGVLKLIAIPCNERHCDEPSTYLMIEYIFTFIMTKEIIPRPFHFLSVDVNAGKWIKNALEKFANDQENIRLPLVVLNVMFQHCSINELDSKIIFTEFIKNGCFNACLEALRTCEHLSEIKYLVLKPILLYHGQYEPAMGWYEGSKVEIAAYLRNFEEYLNFLDDSEANKQLINERLEGFKHFLQNSQCKELSQKKECIDVKTMESSKKNKRRKPLKPKVVKLDSLQKLNEIFQESKEEQKVSKDLPSDVDSTMFEEEKLEHIANSTNSSLTKISPIEEQKDQKDSNDWTNAIRNLEFDNNVMKAYRNALGIDGDPEMVAIDAIIHYLEGLLGLIMKKYQDIEMETVHDEEIAELAFIRREFFKLTGQVKRSYAKERQACYNILKAMEKSLISFVVQGDIQAKSVAEFVRVKMHVKFPSEMEAFLGSYIENVMSGECCQRDDIQIKFIERLSSKQRPDAQSMGDCINNDNEANKNIAQSHDQITKSSWSTRIQNLQLSDYLYSLRNGAINIIKAEKYKDYILPSLGRFGSIEIGVMNDVLPVVVRKLEKNDVAAILLKGLVDPLLYLRHNNILPYQSCIYEDNFFIIAMPLCEYSLEQYVSKMFHAQCQFNHRFIISQILKGLRFLHDAAIVHGNLKPSNVMIDFRRNVKIAEFGISNALVNHCFLPSKSIIWLPTEIYRRFKNVQSMQCTFSSDIQAAGMVVHYASTFGLHPFGSTICDIIINIERASPTIHTADFELNDLLASMLRGDAHRRPNIHRVLSHVFFWPMEKKWTYILLWTGYGVMCTHPVDILILYAILDAIPANASILKEGWIEMVSKQFPEVWLTNAVDTTSGLLKFVRFMIDYNNLHHTFGRNMHLQRFVLETFPQLTVALFRLIEDIQWSQHALFMPFHHIVDY